MLLLVITLLFYILLFIIITIIIYTIILSIFIIFQEFNYQWWERKMSAREKRMAVTWGVGAAWQTLMSDKYKDLRWKAFEKGWEILIIKY